MVSLLLGYLVDVAFHRVAVLFSRGVGYYVLCSIMVCVSVLLIHTAAYRG